MKQPRQVEIAVIGEENLVSLMRFAGVRRYHLIEQDHDVGPQVREAFQDFITDTTLGVILIEQHWSAHLVDLLDSSRQSGAVLPAIIELPEASRSDKDAIREYYKRLTEKLIGFSIEI